MKTLQVDSGRVWRGGQLQVLLLARGLVARGVEVLLACPGQSPLASRARAAGLAVVEFGLEGPLDLVSVYRLRQLIRRERPDVVHGHAAHATQAVAIATLGARGPIRVASRRVDFTPSRAGVAVLRRGADHTIAVSAAVARVLARAGLPPARVSHVASGIDPERARHGDADLARCWLGLEASHRIVGNLAALTAHKDHATLIEAAALLRERYPRLRFVIAGEGELRTELERRIAAARLGERVILAGFRDDVAALFASFELFVLSSRLEGLGTSVLDAMAAGVPVVATSAGGIPELVEAGVTGLVVPPRDPAALAGAIATLLEDPPRARRLAAAASARLEERFRADSMVDATLAVYARLLSERCRGPAPGSSLEAGSERR